MTWRDAGGSVGAPPGFDPPPSPLGPTDGRGAGGAHLPGDPGEPESPQDVTAASTSASLIRLVIVVASLVVLATVTHELPVLIVIAALVLMIMIHELGHFAAAKWSGMKVTEYFLGFGPRLWSVRKGETEYGVKAIPAGGYVRIVGMTSAEELDPTDEPRSYRQASFPRRLAVGVAGSAMHFVMAFVLLFVLFVGVGLPVATGTAVGTLYSFKNGQTPAQLAGIKPGDVFVTIDGRSLTDPNALITFVQDHAGKQLTIVLRRHGRLVTVRVTPVDGRHEVQAGTTTPIRPASGPASGVLGVELATLSKNVTSSFFDSIARAGGMVGSLTKATGVEISQIFSLHGLTSFGADVAGSPGNQASGPQAANRPVSVVGVVQIASQAARQDVGELLFILAAVNIFVGMFNMFPMLPLDGGHVVIAVYERIRSRRGRRYFADVRKMMPVAYLVLAFLIVFGLSALYLDIVHPVHVGG